MEVEEEAEECYDSILNQQIIFEEISKLPIKYREVILLYYYQGLKISEIVKILNKTDSAINQDLQGQKKN